MFVEKLFAFINLSFACRWLCSSNSITNILIVAVIRLPIARTGRKVSEPSCPMSMSVSELCLAAVAATVVKSDTTSQLHIRRRVAVEATDFITGKSTFVYYSS